jgi:hypothetical protein
MRAPKIQKTAMRLNSSWILRCAHAIGRRAEIGYGCVRSAALKSNAEENQRTDKVHSLYKEVGIANLPKIKFNAAPRSIPSVVHSR